MAAEQSIESTETTEVVPGDLTAIFRHYREERGLNINQVAEALCLSPKVVTALETEQLDQLPEPPYVRGYLRSYAKFAEVDPSEMINAYEKLRGAKPNELDYHFAASGSASRNSSSGIGSGILKFILLALLLGLLASLAMIPAVKDWASNTWDKFSQVSNSGFSGSSQTDNPLLTGSIPMPLPLDDAPLANTTTPIEGDLAANGTAVLTSNGNVSFPSVDGGAVSSDDTAEKTTPPGTPEEDGAATSDDTKKAGTDAEGDTDTKKTEVPEGSSSLKMTFNDEVWMRIRDKGKKKLFEALSQKGDSKELVLTKPMVIRVGNAQKLELTVDGKPFDMTPFIRGSVANFTIE